MPKSATNSALAQEAPSKPALAELSTKKFVFENAVKVLDRTVFFGLLALIIITAIPHGTVLPIWVAVFECIVFALGALWSIQSLFSGRWLVSGNRLFAPLLALMLFAFVQIIPMVSESAESGFKVQQTISAAPYETRLFLFKLFALVFVGALLLHYTSGRQRLRSLIHVVIVVGLASAVFGLLRQATQDHDWSVSVPIPHLWNVYLLYLTPDLGYGQFFNRNHFALLMEMTLGLLLGLVVGGGVRGKHLPIYLIAAIPIWTALILTTSRGAILSMVGQLLFIATLFTVVRLPRAIKGHSSGSSSNSSAPKWWRIGSSLVARSALIGCLLIVVVMSVTWVGGDPLVSRLNSVPDEFSNAEVSGNDGTRRIEIWRATWNMIKENPLMGVGFSAYSAAIPQYHDASGKWVPEQAHNDYLEMLASGGLVGAVLAIWFIVVFLRQARERLLRSSDSFRRAACFGALTGLFGVALHSLVDFGIHITINALVCVALIVIATQDVELEPLRSSRRRRIFSLPANR